LSQQQRQIWVMVSFLVTWNTERWPHLEHLQLRPGLYLVDVAGIEPACSQVAGTAEVFSGCICLPIAVPLGPESKPFHAQETIFAILQGFSHLGKQPKT
jgi:hypothetical protein